MLISGANRGLGLEWVRQLDEASWRLLACCRNPAEAQELNAIAAASKGRVSVHPLDIDDHASIDALAAELGGEAIDVLVNNAGVLPTRDVFGATDYAKWDAVLRTNLFGTMKMCEAFAPYVARGRRKIILNMTSTLGSVSSTGSEYIEWGDNKHVYRSSKVAINLITKELSGYLKGDGTTVVSINPGWSNTEMGRADLDPGQTEDLLIAPSESIQGMRKIMDSLTPADSGRLYWWHGEEFPP